MPNYIYSYVSKMSNNEELGSINLTDVFKKIKIIMSLNRYKGVLSLKLPGQYQTEPYNLNLKMKKNQSGMFLVHELSDISSEKFVAGERITYTGNAIDTHNGIFQKNIKKITYFKFYPLFFREKKRKILIKNGW